MPRFNATMTVDGETREKEIMAPSQGDARKMLATDYPGAEIVKVRSETNADEVDAGTEPSTNGAVGREDPFKEALRSKDTIGPVLFLLGWVVIILVGIAGLVLGSMMADVQGATGFWITALGIWVYGVGGLLLMALGQIVTYLHRIQKMQAMERG